MNNVIQQYCRQTLKDNLAKLPKEWQFKFKRMYGENTTLDIDKVVDEMKEEDLESAIRIVQNSLKKIL